MKAVQYSPSVLARPELLGLAEIATERMTSILGEFGRDASVEWGRVEEAPDRPLLTVRLWDELGEVRSAFPPSQLEQTLDMELRVRQLCGRWLREQSDRIVRRMREAAATSEE